MVLLLQLVHDRCTYHMETSLLICRANQWAGFYMVETSIMKMLMLMLVHDNLLNKKSRTKLHKYSE